MRKELRLSRLVPALVIGLAFWALAIGLWAATGSTFWILNFGYIGTAVGVGMGLYLALPKKKKPMGRKLAQFLVGLYMLGFLGVVMREDMQVEGVFFYLLAGFFGGAVLHYLVAKVVGPMLFHRGWCSWACWTAMLLDLLPYPRNRRGRLPERYDRLRYLHFGLSLGLVVTLWLGLGYQIHASPADSLWWLVTGNAVYYAAAIALAFALQDNRAFCKYLCPVPTLQKPFSRLSLLKIATNRERCDDCGACAKACPMDIAIPEYTKAGERVLSTECIFCLTCTTVCAKDALRLSFGFDVGGREALRRRKPTEAAPA